MSFYDEVLRELVVALGAALFLGNIFALWRRRTDRARLAAAAAAKPSRGRHNASKSNAKSGSRPQGRAPKGAPRTGSSSAEPAPGRSADDLAVAPVARTVTYALLGLLMFVAGLASIFVS